MTLTVLAYKPDSDDYCMNCHVASYRSDFRWAAFDSVQAAREFAAVVIADNAFMGTNEEGYEITVLSDGKQWDGQAEFLLGATELAKPIIAERKAAKEAAAKKADADRRRSETQRERAELARLQEKFKTV